MGMKIWSVVRGILVVFLILVGLSDPSMIWMAFVAIAGLFRFPFGSEHSLYKAICNGDIETVDKLLKDGTNINDTIKLDWTPLIWAIFEEKIDMIKFLIANGADITSGCKGLTPLRIAAGSLNIEIVKLLIDNKALDVNPYDVTSSWHFVSSPSITALMSACYPISKDSDAFKNIDNRLSVVKLLIENNSDINAQDDKGKTALHYACENNYIDVVKFLIEAGADTSLEDQNRMTALRVAKEKKHHEIVDILTKGF